MLLGVGHTHLLRLVCLGRIRSSDLGQHISIYSGSFEHHGNISHTPNSSVLYWHQRIVVTEGKGQTYTGAHVPAPARPSQKQIPVGACAKILAALFSVFLSHIPPPPTRQQLQLGLLLQFTATLPVPVWSKPP